MNMSVSSRWNNAIASMPQIACVYRTSFVAAHTQQEEAASFEAASFFVRQLIMLAARRLFRPASADQYDAAHALSRRCAHTAEIHTGWRGVTAAGASIPLNVVTVLSARRETAHRPARHVVDPNFDRTIAG